jgi:type I restriction enzyme S subunit
MTVAVRSVTRLIEEIAEGERESFTVASLRDTLLLKLISGELRVKDAERFIGECT